MGEKYWDDIDCLWMYFINAIKEIKVEGKKKSTFLFPDQPIKVSLEDKGYNLKLSIANEEHIIKKEFFQEMLKGAKEFYTIIIEFAKRKEYRSQLDDIMNLISIETE